MREIKTHMKILGYRSGFRYMQSETDVYRNDYADPPETGRRWFCTIASFPVALEIIGGLDDENGNEIKYG